MNVFRRMSTARLLVLVGVLAASALVAGIAGARGGSGPMPPRRLLAVAIHQALLAKPVQGFSARITFTNHLFPAGSLNAGGSAILAGASGRLWVANDGRFRLELQSDAGDTQVMGAPGELRVYDASTNQEY